MLLLLLLFSAFKSNPEGKLEANIIADVSIASRIFVNVAGFSIYPSNITECPASADDSHKLKTSSCFNAVTAMTLIGSSSSYPGFKLSLRTLSCFLILASVSTPFSCGIMMSNKMHCTSPCLSSMYSIASFPLVAIGESLNPSCSSWFVVTCDTSERERKKEREGGNMSGEKNTTRYPFRKDTAHVAKALFFFVRALFPFVANETITMENVPVCTSRCRPRLKSFSTCCFCCPRRGGVVSFFPRRVTSFVAACFWPPSTLYAQRRSDRRARPTRGNALVL